MSKPSRRKRTGASAGAAPGEAKGDAGKARAAGGKTGSMVFGIGLVAAMVVVLVAAGAWSKGSLTASADTRHGAALYTQYCASCHGATGHGEFDWTNRARGAPALDDSGHAWHHEDRQLLAMILDKPLPDSRMPPWRGVLSRDDAIDLVAFIKSLWSPYIRENCQGARHMECTNSHG